MTLHFSESTVEQAALSWFEGLGYSIVFGADMAPGEPNQERESYDQVILVQRLRDFVERTNLSVPPAAIEDCINKLLKWSAPEVVVSNRQIHQWLALGMEIEYRSSDGQIRTGIVNFIDYHEPDHNDWLVVNQFTVVEGNAKRRPDIVIFLNGLPLALIELKNLADEEATIWTAFQQIQTYKK